jgi:hypothetical protein
VAAAHGYDGTTHDHDAAARTVATVTARRTSTAGAHTRAAWCLRQCWDVTHGAAAVAACDAPSWPCVPPPPAVRRAAVVVALSPCRAVRRAFRWRCAVAASAASAATLAVTATAAGGYGIYHGRTERNGRLRRTAQTAFAPFCS